MKNQTKFGTMGNINLIAGEIPLAEKQELSTTGLILSRVARIIVLIVVLPAFYDAMISSSSLGPLLQIAFILALIAWRFSRGHALFFVPDEMLLALPWVWALSVRTELSQRPDYLLAVIVVLSPMLTGFRSKTGDWFSGGIRVSSLYIAVALSLLFYFSFSGAVKAVYPVYTDEQYASTVRDGLWFFAGLPLVLTAFFPLLKKTLPPRTESIATDI